MPHNVTIRCIAATLLLMLFVAPTRAADAEMIDNPEYTAWAKHKPGTNVAAEMKMNAGGQQMTMQLTQTLLKVEPDHALVEMSTTMNFPGAPAGQARKEQTKIPAKVAKDRAFLPDGFVGTSKEIGTEKIEAAGKSYECKIVEFTGKHEGMDSSGKNWVTQDVPGGLVKTEMKATTPAGPSTMTTTLTAVNVK
jgi:hypothetical protein